jgi:aspartyl-tRNA(Asn)/glutamyl-tRNA(Gln) amidotransferase subunit A
VSRFGLVAFASSLDQIGPLTKDVRDAAILMQAIAGHDVYDSTSGDVAVPDYSQVLEHDIRGMRLGVPREYFVAGMD